MTLKLPKSEKELLAERSRLTGLTYSEYLIALLQHESVDDRGRPTWLDRTRVPDNGELPLAM